MMFQMKSCVTYPVTLTSRPLVALRDLCLYPVASGPPGEDGDLLYSRRSHVTRSGPLGIVCLLVGCLTSQQQASVSQGRICTDNFTCCHTEIDVADQTFSSPSHSILTPGRPVPVLTL